MVSAKRFSPRSGKNRRGTTTTKDQEPLPTPEIEDSVADADDGYFLPDLPGQEPDFWEGPQWDGLGFFVEYLWAFGIVFAVTNNAPNLRFDMFHSLRYSVNISSFVDSACGCCRVYCVF